MKQSKKKIDKHHAISIALPVFSLLIILAAYAFIEPSVTGLVVYDSAEEGLVNADVTLSTKSTSNMGWWLA